MMTNLITADLTGMPCAVARMLAHVGQACLTAEGLAGAYQAGLLITDDEGIAAINREQRGVDRATDVLSFPSAAYPRGTARAYPNRLRRELDIDTGHIHLGDIVLSLPRAQAQAAAYGHALTREIGFLYAHGLLHLMGYDHETDEQRAAMRAMEEDIMEKAGLSRALSDDDFALVDAAREAMRMAYAPYSKYRVGACVRTADGRLHRGCNVENASYGMTICAERNAMTTAVTEGMRRIEAIAIAGEGTMPYPCGACRQFMREFGRDVQVIIAGDERIEVTTLAALLPVSFGPESLAEDGAAQGEGV